MTRCKGAILALLILIGMYLIFSTWPWRPAPSVTEKLPSQSLLLVFDAQVWYSPRSNRYDLFLLDPETGEIWEWKERLLANAPLDWSSAREQLLVTGDYGVKADREHVDRLFLLSEDGSLHEMPLPYEPAPSWVSWSPDGEQIAFSCQRPNDPYTKELCVYDIEHDRLEQLTSLDLLVGSIDWSPDGEKILFSVYDDTVPSTSIYLIRADGTDSQKLLQNSTSPQWSPSGEEFAFSHISRRFGPRSLAIADADGSNPQLIIDVSSVDVAEEGVWTFTWSEDGRSLFFAACPRKSLFSGGSPASGANFCYHYLYEVNLNTGNIEQLSDYPLYPVGQMTVIPAREP